MRTLQKRFSEKNDEKQKTKVVTVLNANIPAPSLEVPVNKEVQELQVKKIEDLKHFVYQYYV
jgi:hypothetical protein